MIRREAWAWALIAVLFGPLAHAADTTSADLVLVQRGTLPIILTAPHPRWTAPSRDAFWRQHLVQVHPFFVPLRLQMPVGVAGLRDRRVPELPLHPPDVGASLEEPGASSSSSSSCDMAGVEV